MKIIPIKFDVALEELSNVSPEGIEQSIKDEIMSHVHDTIASMLDDENFITMSPSKEDQTIFNVELNIMLGSSNEYIDAISETTTILKNHLSILILDNDQKVHATIINDVTKPLVNLVS